MNSSDINSLCGPSSIDVEETQGGHTDMLPEITLSESRLARVSVQQKKWQIEARGRAEKAAAKVESLAKKGGLSPEAVNTFKVEILGVAG